ncbi:MAG: hypothetical protein GXX86_00220, partial [Propionibacterium sp.]|nr:hypothetical protein [Propionibacterium sp.]
AGHRVSFGVVADRSISSGWELNTFCIAVRKAAISSGVPALTRHVVESFAFHAHICVHLRLLAGRDPHHIVEAQFKALARALRDAVAIDPRVSGVPSTKGLL